jgi:ABC-type uncharacterized transport system permease subunit
MRHPVIRLLEAMAAVLIVVLAYATLPALVSLAGIEALLLLALLSSGAVVVNRLWRRLPDHEARP